MTKTTNVGGFISKTIKGNFTSYAGEGIEYNVTGKLNLTCDGEMSFDKADKAPEKKIEENKIFTACIQFYRSREQSNNLYGNKDTSYKGEFGFDKFDKEVCAEGLIGNYEQLNGIIPKKEVINGVKKYICAYLSIWPPNVEGNLDNKKSNVKLYIKAEKAITELAKIGDIEFTSSHPNIVINGSNTLNLTIDGELKELSIESKGTFENDVYIEAKAKGESQVLGKLIIKANATIYKTIVQPVLVNFAPNATFVKDEPLTSTSFPFAFQGLMDYLNTKSFNQAYILSEKPQFIKTYDIVRNELITSNFISQDPNDLKYYLAADNNTRTIFNKKIEELYTASQNGKGAETIHKENTQALKDSGVSEAIEKYIVKFKAEYDYTNDLNNSETEKIKKKHASKIVTEAINHKKVTELYSDYLIKRKEYDRIIATKGINPQSQKMNKSNTIHVFVYSGIEGAYNGTVPGVAAYSLPYSGIVHIFNTTSKHKDVYELIAHEMGHSLGLPHTFEKEVDIEYLYDNTKKSKQNLEKDKKEIERKLREINKKIERKEENLIENTELISINENYKFLKNRLLSIIKYSQNPDSFEKGIINFCNEIKVNETTEISSLNMTEVETFSEKKLKLENENEEIKNKLKTAEKAIKLLSYKYQSTTQENYMDYFLDTSGSINSNFRFKVFSKSQWKVMQDTGLNSEFFKK